MNFTTTYLHYSATNAFSKLVEDYLSGDSLLRDFYEHPNNLEGMMASIEARRKMPVNRLLLVEEMTKSYNSIAIDEKVKNNISSLLNENTFTICTAHQPNIFSGPLYVIYKVLHAIKLADELNQLIPSCHFVPIYFMGSEDADLHELGNVHLAGKKYEWETNQKGAVGRMKVDDELLRLLQMIYDEWSALPHAGEMLSIFKDAYKQGSTIEQATFDLFNAFFAKFGLLILQPDNVHYKKACIDLFKDDLLSHFSSNQLIETVNQFPKEYKIQVLGRDINLFYLDGDLRERIVSNEDGFSVLNTNLQFTKEEMIAELQQHPERFSPNVILRPLMQELLLPNIAFIGGGGELAYWLELKRIFKKKNIPYPVLILRNSFLLIDKKQQELIKYFQLNPVDLFVAKNILIQKIVTHLSGSDLRLTDEKNRLKDLYAQIEERAGNIDSTLSKHVVSLYVRSVKKMESLEKKMLKAEKKKYSSECNQLLFCIDQLFPNNILQERSENISLYYARYGASFINQIYQSSNAMNQQFCIITES